ncbi:ABC transporter permease [Streptomyces sp. NPDC001118]
MTAPATVRLPGHEDGRPPAQRAGRLAAEWRAGRMVWRREMIHFFRDRTRVVVSLLQPLVFLYILGVGLSRLVAEGSSDNYLLFLFPGVLVMAAQAPAISVGASIVWDRQSGFLREMLVAPVRRSTLSPTQDTLALLLFVQFEVPVDEQMDIAAVPADQAGCRLVCPSQVHELHAGTVELHLPVPEEVSLTEVALDPHAPESRANWFGHVSTFPIPMNRRSGEPSRTQTAWRAA